MAPAQHREEHVDFLSNNLNPFGPLNGGCLVNNLPAELLFLIFQFGFSDCSRDNGCRGNYLQHFDRMSYPQKPQASSCPVTSSYPCGSFSVVVSHVCRYWRNVAISNASLWTAITLPDIGIVWPSPSCCNSLNMHIESHLERSHDLPIDFRCVITTPTLYSLLTSHTHRWRSLKIDFREHSCLPAFLDAASHPSVPVAAQLTTLQLRHITRSRKDIWRLKQLKPLFGGFALRLETVILDGVPINWNQPWISSASNLISLQLAHHRVDSRPSWAQFETILRGAPKLRKLCLCSSGPSEVEPGEAITLVNLMYLFLKHEDEASLLQRLYTPSLKSLDLGSRCRGFPTTHSYRAPFRSLLHKLETFKISLHPSVSRNVEELYSQLWNLRSLRIQCHPDGCSILGCIEILHSTSSTGRGILLPSLEKLYISSRLYIDLPAVRKVVQARKESGYPLQSLHLEEWIARWGHDVDVNELDWFRDHVEEFTFSRVSKSFYASDCLGNMFGDG